MDNRDELQRRRQAIRLWLTDTPIPEILRRVQRSRAWLGKWRQRFQRKSWRGLRSRSRRPRRNPEAYSARIVRLIVQTRRRLARQRVGLSGPRAIQRELRQAGLGKRTPSLATIKRVLHAHGLSTQRSNRHRLIVPHRRPRSAEPCTPSIGPVAIWSMARKSMPFTR